MRIICIEFLEILLAHYFYWDICVIYMKLDCILESLALLNIFIILQYSLRSTWLSSADEIERRKKCAAIIEILRLNNSIPCSSSFCCSCLSNFYFLGKENNFFLCVSFIIPFLIHWRHTSSWSSLIIVRVMWLRWRVQL